MSEGVWSCDLERGRGLLSMSRSRGGGHVFENADGGWAVRLLFCRVGGGSYRIVVGEYRTVL